MTGTETGSVEICLYHQYREVVRWVVPGPRIPLASLWDRPPRSASGGLDPDQYRDALDGDLLLEGSRWVYHRIGGRTRTAPVWLDGRFRVADGASVDILAGSVISVGELRLLIVNTIRPRRPGKPMRLNLLAGR